MRKLDIAQRSQEWFKMRREKIGASDAPAIMGVSPWCTPYQKWEEKIFQKEKETTPSMQRGIDMENLAKEHFEAETGILVIPCVILHPKFDWMVASLDGLDINEEAIVEIKCPGKEDHDLAKRGKVPEKYIPQLQHQMEVCEKEEVYYYSFSGEDGVIVILKRDDKYIEKMLEAEKEFLNHMHDLTPPKLTDKDIVERDDLEWIKASEEWKRLNIQMEEIERNMKEARETLIALAAGRCCQGEGIRLTHCMMKGRVDYGAIPEIKSINLEAYRKEPIESWRISKV